MKADFKKRAVQSLYFKENHLLVVDGYYSNRIRRFYYKDLEVLFSTYYRGRQRALGIVLVCVLLSLLIPVQMPAGESTWIALFIVLSFWVLVGPFICLAVPNRKVYLQTRVQRHELKCVVSVKKYRKLQEMLGERLAPVGNWGEQADLRQHVKALVDVKDSMGKPPPLPREGFSL